MVSQGLTIFVSAALVFCCLVRAVECAENNTTLPSNDSIDGNNQSKSEMKLPNVTSVSVTTTPQPPSKGEANYCPGNHSLLLLPGYGWDNLRNQKMEQIFDVSYFQCDSTNDGQYLIPDNISISAQSPVREELRAALFQHWNSFVSSTADSINKEGDSLFNTPGLSGSFTSAYQRVKESLVKDKAITSRVELRYPFFTVGLSLESRVGDKFKGDIYYISNLLTSRRFLEACYYTELLITKYGTHYIDRVELGATISQEDSLLKSVLNVSTLEMQTDTVATAVAFFLKGVGMSLYKPTALILNSFESENYLKARLTKLNLSIGGRFPESETSISGWLKSIIKNPAVIQQEGKPLYELLTNENFPYMIASNRDSVRQKIKEAIKEYYELNYHKGCTHMDSPNFSYQALKDDGSCKLLRKPVIFGGVYQTCEMVRSDAGDMCGNMTVNNSLNGELKCGSGFQTILLYSSNKTIQKDGKVCKEKCTGLWVFRKCENVCGNSPSYSRANYSVYWCVAEANGTNVSSSGLQFGGVFNNIRPNPITNGKTCPTNFQAIELYDDITVCVSKSNPPEDSADSVVFGGFYTCSEGNPLSTDKTKQNTSKNKAVVEVQIDSEGASGGIAINHGSPRNCPTGYATHKLPTLDNCNIYYCINNIVSTKNFTPPTLITPPFCAFNPNISITPGLTLPPPETTKYSEIVEKASQSGVPSDIVAGIVMAVLFLIIVIGIGVMVYVKKKKDRECGVLQNDYKELID